MNRGTLKCVGSSLFLKSRYGYGYQLRMVRGEAGPRVEACTPEAVSAFLRQHVPSVELVSDAGSELKYLVPLQEKQHFAQLFTELDANLAQLNIVTYGLSLPTLEEVLLAWPLPLNLGSYDMPAAGLSVACSRVSAGRPAHMCITQTVL